MDLIDNNNNDKNSKFKSYENNDILNYQDNNDNNLLMIENNNSNLKSFRSENILLSGHEDEVLSVCFNNNNLLSSGGLDKNILIWDLENNGKNVQILKGSKGGITDIKWSNDQFIYATSSDNYLSLWDINNSTRLKKWTKDNSIINCLALNKRGEDKICIGNDKGSIYIYNNKDKDSILTIDLGVPILSLECDNFMEKLYIGTVDNKILIYDMRINKYSNILDKHTDSISGLKINSSNSNLLSVSFDESMIWWDLKTNKPINEFKGFYSSINKYLFRCDISFDDKYFSCGSSDGLLNIYNKNNQVFKLEGHNGYVNDISFLNKSHIIASCSNDWKIIITDLSKI